MHTGAHGDSTMDSGKRSPQKANTLSPGPILSLGQVTQSLGYSYEIAIIIPTDPHAGNGLMPTEGLFMRFMSGWLAFRVAVSKSGSVC